MNKQAARKKAESETISVGELRTMIAAAAVRGGMSRVNPALTIAETTAIYSGALAGRNDAEVPKAWRSDPYTGVSTMQPTRDAWIITKILRDCARGATTMTEQMHTPTDALVKPLEWTEGNGDEFCFVNYSADTIGGSYTIEHRRHGAIDLWLPRQSQARRFDTLNAAKAAAQADYEQRILSALAAPAASSQERIAQLEAQGREAAASVIESHKYKPWTVDSALEIADAAIRAYLAALGAQPLAPEPEGSPIVCRVMPMKLSSGETDYYVSIERDGRQITPHRHRIKGRAEYEVARWNHVLNDADEPDILAFDCEEPSAAVVGAAK